MEENRTKPSVKTYLLHWLDYCYYRIVQFFTPEGTKEEDVEYCFGAFHLGVFFANIILIVLDSFNIGVIEWTRNHRIFYAVTLFFLSCFIFPEEMHHRAEALFGEESHK